ncbi:MAG TPA: pseudouridine synthase [Bacteroidales bacterium]|nr:pseudouridine synthase [Bacteroidales bacterium]
MENKKRNNTKKKFNKSSKTFKQTKKKTGDHVRKFNQPIRLNRYIANAGICSRREADDLIKKGFITVNAEKITELGVKVSPKDVVRYKGAVVSREKKVYILLNKPKDVISTVRDKHASRTVIDLVKNACPERVYPVGRLDKNTTGVLLLTNDGELTKQLTHPKYKKKKIYHVVLDKDVAKQHMVQIVEGIKLDEDYIEADAISYVVENDKTQIGIEIHSGQNRIVRRIFESLGYKIKKLDRVYFAGLTKKNLPRGKWRFLTPLEISNLKRKSFN